MEDRKIFITHGGKWEGSVYIGGSTDMCLVQPGLTYEGLIELVHDIVNADCNQCKYDMRAVMNDEGKVCRFKIKNDRDIQYLLGFENGKPELYVCVQHLDKCVNQDVLLQAQQLAERMVQPFQCPNGKNFSSISGSNQVHGPQEGFREQRCSEPSRAPIVHGHEEGRGILENNSRLRVETTETELGNESYSTDELDDEHGIDWTDLNIFNFDDVYPCPEVVTSHVNVRTQNVNDRGPEQHRIRVPDLNVTNYEPSEETAQGTITRKEWIIPGSADISLQTLPSVMSSTQNDILYKDAIFGTKDELKDNLGMFALKRKFEYRVRRSSTTRFDASCRDNGCTFKIRAHGSEGGMWRVVQFVKDHSCNADLETNRPRQVPTKVISTIIASRLQGNGRTIRPLDVIGEIRADHGIEILYSKAWRAREYAQNLVYGDPSQSFHLLPSYLYMLEKENPGTMTKLQTDAENKFEFLFVAIGPSIHGFRTCCRPIIVIDGTHLKGKFRGVMFVAATKDGNEQIFPVAFGFGDGENDRSWTWFLTELRNVIGSPNDLMIVSDRHKSIENAINAVFPGIAHGLCTYHLKQNLKKFRNADVNSTFTVVSRLYRQADFNKQMFDFRNKHARAYQYLLEAGVVRWSRAYSPVRRYDFMTSNVAENVNACMKHARKLPIVTLLEFARNMLQRWFYDRRNDSAARDTPLSEWASSRLRESLEDAQYLSVEPVDNVKFNVSDPAQSWVVQLEDRTCTCRHFDLDLLPCAHAAAAIRHAKRSMVAYCSEYYHSSTLVETYSGRVNPLGHPDEWDVPDEVKAQVVLPPEYHAQSGRPRTKRIPSAGERRRRRQQLCSRCKQSGHNRVNCNNPVHASWGSTSV